MTSWVVWAVTAAVALLIGFAATHFTARTLRWVTAVIILALLVAVTAYGQTPPVGTGQPNLQAAFAFGSDRLAAAWFHPLWTLWSASATPAPGRLGWSAIAVLLLLGYRQAETWALRRQAPRLDTSKLDDVQPSVVGDGSAFTEGSGPTAGQRHEWLAAEVKFRLAAIDVFAPPILPGGTRTNGLASIAAASGVAGADLAAAVLRVLGPLWPAPRRYELRVWVEGTPSENRLRRRALGAPGAYSAAAHDAVAQALTVVGRGGAERARREPPQPTRVTVDLDEPGTGATVASKTIVAADIDDAASMVAGFVARHIFARDPASPAWCYGAADGRDLGLLGLARQDRVYVEDAGDVQRSRRRQIELLSAVTGADRCAGLVRYELAQLWDLERDQFAALRLHAMNREQYPRFFRGTYRLCMSLEMIADPAFVIDRPELARSVLDETLAVLYQAGVLTNRDRCGPGDIYPKGQAGAVIEVTGADKHIGPYVLSHELREDLLAAARSELWTIRRQLWLPVVMWNTLWRRDERATWLPHWHLAHRQEFRDGVCAAEILIAVKHQLNQRSLAAKAKPTASRAGRTREWLRLRRGLQVVAAVTGGSASVRAVLLRDFADWPAPGQAAPSPASAPGVLGRWLARRAAGPAWVPPTRARVRWLPWQRRTGSWTAAYNTACLYAVLLQAGLATEEQVIASLRRMVNNRDSGLERPYDWISNDPDFAPLFADSGRYPEVGAFLSALERRDYPARQITGPLPTARREP